MLYGKNFGSMNFADAKDQCNNEIDDVSLPLPNSALENEFIRSLLVPNKEQAWLGITDEVWGFETCEFHFYFCCINLIILKTLFSGARGNVEGL